MGTGTIMDYKKAGVNIEAGELLVEKIKPTVAATRTAGVLSDIGLFGGFFDARFPDYRHPVLVASTDGVGTKLKIAIMANRHDTVGQCLVNHCVNDILACGARPLFFLDYYATGALNADVAADVITGIATACKQNDCAVLGGETAEMPSIYANDDYDVAGTIVGIVEKDSILNGSRVEVGNVLIGLPSAGLHTNGYSLARKALFPRYDIHDHVAELGGSLADAGGAASPDRVGQSRFRVRQGLRLPNLPARGLLHRSCQRGHALPPAHFQHAGRAARRSCQVATAPCDLGRREYDRERDGAEGRSGQAGVGTGVY